MTKLLEKLVQIDVEEPIARNDPPSQHVGIVRATDDEIGWPRIGNAFEEAEERIHLG